MNKKSCVCFSCGSLALLGTGSFSPSTPKSLTARPRKSFVRSSVTTFAALEKRIHALYVRRPFDLPLNTPKFSRGLPVTAGSMVKFALTQALDFACVSR